MSRRKFLLSGAAAAAALPLSTGTAQARERAADLIVHSGRVFALDSGAGAAEAVAIRDGRIIAVGSDRALRSYIGRGTRLLDAAGGTVLPGINDSHIHLSSFGLTFAPFSFDVDTATIDELVARIADAVAAAGPDEWIRGRGWNETRLPRAPTRADLDPVSDGRPVYLVDFTLHAIAVNSRVLELAGITRDTVPPAGGVIEKDAAGEPTGVLREGAQDLVAGIVPAYTPEQQAQAISGAIGVLHAQGVTSVTEPGIPLELLDLYAGLSRSGRLPLRLTALLHAGSSPASLREVLDGYQPLADVDPRALRVAGLKIFADGVPTGARTAWLNEPYSDGTNGALTIAGADAATQLANLHEMILLGHRAGMQMATHACGDATIDAVVDGYVSALNGGMARDRRHYVIHGDLATRQALRTMGARGIGVNMNAQIRYLIDNSLEGLLGPERIAWHWPYRTALDSGVRVSSGSDAPVTFPDWRQGVMSAVLRIGSQGHIVGPEEAIGLREAVRTYTSTPAWQDAADAWKGTLTPGKVGDVCVLDADIERLDPSELPGVAVQSTVLGGDVVYERSGATGRPVRSAAGAHARHGASCFDHEHCCCTLSSVIRAGLA